MANEGWVGRMKGRWGLGPWGVIAVLLAFSLAGSSLLFLGRPIIGSLLPDDSPFWLKAVAYLLVCAPLYQALLLAYGALLGQFSFFWEREKKLGRLLLRWLGLRSEEPVRDSGT